MSKKSLPLIVEGTANELWGRVTINENLIVDSASTLEALKKQLKKLILEIEEVEVEDFQVSYDLTSFFTEHSYLNVSDIAKRVGINENLMRQYASGHKFPSEERVKEIQKSIREIGKELSKTNLHKPKKEYAHA